MTGPASPPSVQLILCYDGSADATHAIEVAGAMFAGTRALVATVWQPTLGLNSLAWSATTPIAASYEPDPAAGAGLRMAEQGARLARRVGLAAEAVALEADGGVWKAIIETANDNPGAIIVTGCRGRSGLGSRLLGSVSGAVVRHAQQPTLVIPARSSRDVRRAQVESCRTDSTPRGSSEARTMPAASMAADD